MKPLMPPSPVPHSWTIKGLAPARAANLYPLMMWVALNMYNAGAGDKLTPMKPNGNNV